MLANDAIAASPVSGLAPETPALTELDGRKWGSWHLYEVAPDDYVHVVSVVLPPIVKTLLALSLVDCFFFIRYSDERGHHVRLRFRFRDGGSDAAGQVTRVISGMAAKRGLTALPRLFELEVERYGGLGYLPLSLNFFCLSSMATLNWLECHSDEPKTRQLPMLMSLLASQAVALARSLAELTMLLDYFAGWRARMEAPKQHGDRIFERQSEELISLLRLSIETTLSAEAPQKALIEGGRALSLATLGLAPKTRMEILLSQMHMTANRLGLRNTEETYVTQILQRALNGLVQGDFHYARELDAGLARQQSTAGLDVLVNHFLETR